MAVSYINELKATTATSDTSRETKTLATSLEDDIWILQVTYDTYSNGSFTIGSWMAANGWTTIQASASALPDIALMWKRMGATPDTSVQIERSATTAGTGNVIAQLFRGVDPVTALDVTSTSATGGSGDPDNPSITPTNDNCMIVIVAGGDDDTGTLTTTPSGYSNTTFQATGSGTSTDTTAAMASKILATAAAENPAAWVWGAFDDAWIAWTIALRPFTGWIEGTMKAYNGATWDTGVLKSYNGSTWDVAAPKVYNP